MDFPAWYSEWASAHRTAFMLPAEWLAAAGAWWQVFVSLGVKPGELTAATREVQSGTPPRFPGDHLPAVKAALGRVRDAAAAEARRAADSDDGRSVCVDCADTGWVTVPHPAFLDPFGEWLPSGHGPDGEPLLVVGSVACRCQKGLRTADGTDGRRPMGISRYERRCRTWRDQMRAQELGRSIRTDVERNYPAGLVAMVAAGTRMGH